MLTPDELVRRQREIALRDVQATTNKAPQPLSMDRSGKKEIKGYLYPLYDFSTKYRERIIPSNYIPSNNIVLTPSLFSFKFDRKKDNVENVFQGSVGEDSVLNMIKLSISNIIIPNYLKWSGPNTLKNYPSLRLRIDLGSNDSFNSTTSTEIFSNYSFKYKIERMPTANNVSNDISNDKYLLLTPNSTTENTITFRAPRVVNRIVFSFYFDDRQILQFGPDMFQSEMKFGPFIKYDGSIVPDSYVAESIVDELGHSLTEEDNLEIVMIKSDSEIRTELQNLLSSPIYVNEVTIKKIRDAFLNDVKGLNNLYVGITDPVKQEELKKKADNSFSLKGYTDDWLKNMFGQYTRLGDNNFYYVSDIFSDPDINDQYAASLTTAYVRNPQDWINRVIPTGIHINLVNLANGLMNLYRTAFKTFTIDLIKNKQQFTTKTSQGYYNFPENDAYLRAMNGLITTSEDETKLTTDKLLTARNALVGLSDQEKTMISSLNQYINLLINIQNDMIEVSNGMSIEYSNYVVIGQNNSKSIETYYGVDYTKSQQISDWSFVPFYVGNSYKFNLSDTSNYNLNVRPKFQIRDIDTGTLYIDYSPANYPLYVVESTEPPGITGSYVIFNVDQSLISLIATYPGSALFIVYEETDQMFRLYVENTRFNELDTLFKTLPDVDSNGHDYQWYVDEIAALNSTISTLQSEILSLQQQIEDLQTQSSSTSSDKNTAEICLQTAINDRDMLLQKRASLQREIDIATVTIRQNQFRRSENMLIIASKLNDYNQEIGATQKTALQTVDIYVTKQVSYRINSTQKDELRLYKGYVYIFDLNDSSIAYPNDELFFSTTPNGTHGGGIKLEIPGVITYNNATRKVTVDITTDANYALLPAQFYMYGSLSVDAGNAISPITGEYYNKIVILNNTTDYQTEMNNINIQIANIDTEILSYNNQINEIQNLTSMIRLNNRVYPIKVCKFTNPITSVDSFELALSACKSSTELHYFVNDHTFLDWTEHNATIDDPTMELTNLGFVTEDDYHNQIFTSPVTTWSTINGTVAEIYIDSSMLPLNTMRYYIVDLDNTNRGGVLMIVHVDDNTDSDKLAKNTNALTLSLAAIKNQKVYGPRLLELENVKIDIQQKIHPDTVIDFDTYDANTELAQLRQDLTDARDSLSIAEASVPALIQSKVVQTNELEEEKLRITELRYGVSDNANQFIIEESVNLNNPSLSPEQNVFRQIIVVKIPSGRYTVSELSEVIEQRLNDLTKFNLKYSIDIESVITGAINYSFVAPSQLLTWQAMKSLNPSIPDITSDPTWADNMAISSTILASNISALDEVVEYNYNEYTADNRAFLSMSNDVADPAVDTSAASGDYAARDNSFVVRNSLQYDQTEVLCKWSADHKNVTVLSRVYINHIWTTASHITIEDIIDPTDADYSTVFMTKIPQSVDQNHELFIIYGLANTTTHECFARLLSCSKDSSILKDLGSFTMDTELFHLATTTPTIIHSVDPVPTAIQLGLMDPTTLTITDDFYNASFALQPLMVAFDGQIWKPEVYSASAISGTLVIPLFGVRPRDINQPDTTPDLLGNVDMYRLSISYSKVAGYPQQVVWEPSTFEDATEELSQSEGMVLNSEVVPYTNVGVPATYEMLGIEDRANKYHVVLNDRPTQRVFWKGVSGLVQVAPMTWIIAIRTLREPDSRAQASDPILSLVPSTVFMTIKFGFRSITSDYSVPTATIANQTYLDNFYGLVGSDHVVVVDDGSEVMLLARSEWSSSVAAPVESNNLLRWTIVESINPDGKDLIGSDRIADVTSDPDLVKVSPNDEYSELTNDQIEDLIIIPSASINNTVSVVKLSIKNNSSLSLTAKTVLPAPTSGSLPSATPALAMKHVRDEIYEVAGFYNNGTYYQLLIQEFMSSITPHKFYYSTSQEYRAVVFKSTDASSYVTELLRYCPTDGNTLSNPANIRGTDSIGINIMLFDNYHSVITNPIASGTTSRYYDSSSGLIHYVSNLHSPLDIDAIIDDNQWTIPRELMGLSNNVDEALPFVSLQINDTTDYDSIKSSLQTTLVSLEEAYVDIDKYKFDIERLSTWTSLVAKYLNLLESLTFASHKDYNILMKMSEDVIFDERVIKLKRESLDSVMNRRSQLEQQKSALISQYTSVKSENDKLSTELVTMIGSLNDINNSIAAQNIAISTAQTNIEEITNQRLGVKIGTTWTYPDTLGEKIEEYENIIINSSGSTEDVIETLQAELNIKTQDMQNAQTDLEALINDLIAFLRNPTYFVANRSEADELADIYFNMLDSNLQQKYINANNDYTLALNELKALQTRINALEGQISVYEDVIINNKLTILQTKINIYVHMLKMKIGYSTNINQVFSNDQVISLVYFVNLVINIQLFNESRKFSFNVNGTILQNNYTQHIDPVN